ncbi:MAG: cytidine deaminase [Clostridia bacterium]|nr:cytidine deaminase [Clostridia bacterium]
MQEETLDSLIDAATEASRNSYSPYSNFPVGAAVLTDSGRIYSGTNIENASYGATVCAERVAIFKAVSDGETKISALAVYTTAANIAFPCGMCLQVMSEFCEDIPVILASDAVVRVYQLSELMPHRFGDPS